MFTPSQLCIPSRLFVTHSLCLGVCYKEAGWETCRGEPNPKQDSSTCRHEEEKQFAAVPNQLSCIGYQLSSNTGETRVVQLANGACVHQEPSYCKLLFREGRYARAPSPLHTLHSCTTLPPMHHVRKYTSSILQPQEAREFTAISCCPVWIIASLRAFSSTCRDRLHGSSPSTRFALARL